MLNYENIPALWRRPASAEKALCRMGYSARKGAAIKPQDVNPTRAGTAARPEPEDPAVMEPGNLYGPRLLPRLVQKIAIAKRAEILSRHAKKEGDPGGVFRII